MLWVLPAFLRAWGWFLASQACCLLHAGAEGAAVAEAQEIWILSWLR